MSSYSFEKAPGTVSSGCNSDISEKSLQHKSPHISTPKRAKRVYFYYNN